VVYLQTVSCTPAESGGEAVDVAQSRQCQRLSPLMFEDED
jgi:hypothetical protein